MTQNQPPRPASLLPEITAPPAFTTKQARSAMSTRRLLDAAAELIADVGLHNTTLAMIGERAGYSHGLVTRRFGSKEGLLMALLDKMSTGWFETHVDPKVDTATGIEALRIRIRSVRQGWEISQLRMRAFYTLMFEGATEPIPALREHIRQLQILNLTTTEAVIERGITDGTLRRDLDPAAVSRFITSALRGVAFHALLLPEREDIFDALDDILRYVDSLEA